MKNFGILVLFSFVVQLATAQPIAKKDYRFLQQKEDSLKGYADSIVMGSTTQMRFNSDSIFTRMFVKALATPYSFHYPFETLATISIQYPPDSSFRIFTWQMLINEQLTRQHGAIQMKTADGKLKLFPLIDKSDVITRIHDTTGNNRGWFGAVYYKIIQTKDEDKTYYTLLGFDENSNLSNRKVIEVLTFKKGEPWFGGKYFMFDEKNRPVLTGSRYIMEYKKNAGARLTYDKDLDMIIAEHLESETGEPKKKWTYIPDGDYEGFKWTDGRWVHVEKVFDQVTPEGKEPVPSPLKDDKGKTFEEQLNDNYPPEAAENTAPASPLPKTKKRKP